MRRDRLRSHRWSLTFGLATSVTLHAIALLLPLPAQVGDDEAGEPVYSDVDAGPWTRLYVLAPAERALPDRPLGPARRAEPPPARPSSIPEPDDGPANPSDGARLEPAPRPKLAARLRDRRLWRSPAPVSAVEATLDRPLLMYRIRALNDSIAREPVSVRGVAEWTTGGGWGFSPGRIHVGSTVLPYCGGASPVDCGFGLRADARDAHARRAYTHREIERQGRQAELDDLRRERARAIRARRDAQRPDTIARLH